MRTLHVNLSTGEQKVREWTPEEIAESQAVHDAYWKERGSGLVKAEATRRITSIMPPWMIEREFTGGKPIPEEVKQAVSAIRAASDVLEAMDPIPEDCTDNSYWP